MSNGTKEITFVFGYICSGKTTYCLDFCVNHSDEVKYIKISDIVKELSSFNKRSDLHTTKSLDTEIAAHLRASIRNSHERIIIVDGIRQYSILKEALDYFDDEYHQIELKWLYSDLEKLKERYNSRGSDKDDQSFQRALQQDLELGLFDLQNKLFHNHNVDFIKT